MRVAVTGTPGTGKTTATDLLAAADSDADSDADADADRDLSLAPGFDLDRDFDLDVVHLNDAIREEGLHEGRDEARDSLITDLDAVREWLGDRDDVLVDSHLAHHVAADRVVVLRCRPDELERRLTERGEPEPKAVENAESEALDVILSEAVAEHGLENVYEIDTTDRDPEDVAADIAAVVAGEREPSAGNVEFTDYL